MEICTQRGILVWIKSSNDLYFLGLFFVIIMITRLITNRIGFYLFSSAGPKIINGVAMYELPQV